MTILYANAQTDLTSYNLNFWYANVVFDEFNDDAYLDGYEDNYFLYTDTNDALALYGTGFAYSGEDMYFGTIEALSQWAWVVDETLTDGGYWAELWHWEGWNFAMETFWETADTTSLADDLDLISDVMSGADTVYLDVYDDAMRGFRGDDTIYGGDGHDTLDGNDGDDYLWGGSKGDVLGGGEGNDELHGRRGFDTLNGGDGNDYLDGGIHDDDLDGGNGDDELYGGDQHDTLYGNSGVDILRGGSGDDTLRGGSERDELAGGTGADTFTFVTGDEKDVILDFDVVGGTQDMLDLSGLASITGWNDLVNNHMSQSGDHVRIDAGGGDLIVLRDLDMGDLDQSNFMF